MNFILSFVLGAIIGIVGASRGWSLLKTLLIAFLINTLCMTVAHAASTGTITLSGTIPAVTSVTVASATGYNSLDLTQNQSNLQVATINETNNTLNGYSLSIKSDNAGQLKNGVVGAVNYTAKYNGTSVSLSSTPVVITNQGAQSSPINVNKSLTIDYTGQVSSTLMQGSYTDTLTLSITAN